jgi:hypothetical protein
LQNFGILFQKPSTLHLVALGVRYDGASKVLARKPPKENTSSYNLYCDHVSHRYPLLPRQSRPLLCRYVAFTPRKRLNLEPSKFGISKILPFAVRVAWFCRLREILLPFRGRTAFSWGNESIEVDESLNARDNSNFNFDKKKFLKLGSAFIWSVNGLD